MSIYLKKSRWKIWLLLTAVVIGIASLYYTNILVDRLAIEERKKVELWAEATKRIVDDESSQNFDFLLRVIKNNETVPAIVLDDNGEVVYHRNLDTTKLKKEKYLQKKLKEMKEYSEPIIIELPDKQYQYFYYSRSTVLTSLLYYPYIQLAIIFLFILISYLAFSSSRKAEQNQVWVGLSKETAHQLGTPISSLLAWLEIARSGEINNSMINEFEKDVLRLEKITERFSKIGSKPSLQPKIIYEVLNNALNYIKTRVSKKVEISLESNNKTIMAPINSELFEWVIENICKNAVDAIEGEGRIIVNLTATENEVNIDITDNGKGISKSKQKTIFKPGFTTKNRGWGLGLSLARRIIEEYHNGKIFVLLSEHGKGTTFRIVLTH